MVSDQDRQALLSRMKRIEGQLRGIRKMIEAGADCAAVAQQLSAARKGLDGSFYRMLACALDHRLAEDTGGGRRVRARISEITGLLSKFA